VVFLQIKKLMRLGGKSVEVAVKLQLKFLLSPSAQQIYSWFGRKGKKPFGTLILASVVSSKPAAYMLLYIHVE